MKVCSVEGCVKGAGAALGYCWTHYRRHLRHGDVSVRLSRYGKQVKDHCEVPRCGHSHLANGLCRKHYNRQVFRGHERTPEGVRMDDLGRALEVLDHYGLVASVRLGDEGAA